MNCGTVNSETNSSFQWGSSVSDLSLQIQETQQDALFPICVLLEKYKKKKGAKSSWRKCKEERQKSFPLFR